VTRARSGSARGRLALAALALVIPAACSSTGAAPTVVTVQTTVAPSTSASSTSAPTTSAAPTSSGPSESSASSTSPAAPSTPATSSAIRSATISKTAPTRTVGPPRATLVVRPQTDPDTPGPDGDAKCAADPQYYDEASTGMLPDVAAGWAAAKKKASAAGIDLCLNDGKRSRAQQQAQYDEYVKEYGTDYADTLVLPWQKSAHVAGYAADVQPAQAYQWLQATAGSLGWCRIYDNEAWHFEFAAQYRTTGCPARLPAPER
jgi:LAS superfamily LD-carboxypeptidase LdcB